MAHGWEARAVERNLRSCRGSTCRCASCLHPGGVTKTKGLWPELLDSGKLEAYGPQWWNGQQGAGDLYHLIGQLLDASCSTLDHVSSIPFQPAVEKVPPLRSASCRKGVCFVSRERWVRNLSLSEQCQVYLANSGVIVRVCPSSSRPVLAKQPDPAF